ncbi:Hypothetical_protein [Hexamita inflata]|uniref:Hypothetical_protein n=1 Tax=Hexamita inflata TaxID=28002 RepID=A0AA86PWZ1_9EUKA|nr:Hypothetical protein HINF_LOCUS35434 [Hexamita inflata]
MQDFSSVFVRKKMPLFLLVLNQPYVRLSFGQNLTGSDAIIFSRIRFDCGAVCSGPRIKSNISSGQTKPTHSLSFTRFMRLPLRMILALEPACIFGSEAKQYDVLNPRAPRRRLHLCQHKTNETSRFATTSASL